MSKKALVFLVDGAEEIEFVISVDVLRRAGVEVIIAGVPDGNPMECEMGVIIIPEISISEAKSKGPYDVVVLPGRCDGADISCVCNAVGRIIREQEESGGIIAAICSAPYALRTHRVGLGKTVTSHPDLETDIKAGGKYNYSEDKVVADGNLITSRGPGTSFEFALKILDQLLGKEKTVQVATDLLLSY